MLNYLVRLGWSHGDQEVFSIEEMVEHFDIANVNQSASSFNPEKLLWISQQHIISAPAEKLGEALSPYLMAIGLNPEQGPNPEDVASIYRERAETLVQMAEGARYCYEDFADIDANAAKKNLRPVVLEPLQAARDALQDLESWDIEAIDKAIQSVAASFEIKLGKLGQPLRVAVTGGAVSPPIDATVWLVGKERTIKRLDHALELVKIRAASS